MNDEESAEPYGPVLTPLIAAAKPPPLDEGVATSVDGLTLLDVGAAFAHTRVGDAGMADCCVAGIWLLYNELGHAHRLCQDVPTPSGSYWHGVVHRRERDYGNAQYWFSRGTTHPVIPRIAAEVDAAAVFPDGWSPEAMVDGCRRAARGDDELAAACAHAQAVEWRLLFDHCYRAATA
ncbi:MAG: hypothetical protein AAFV43_02280 [Planctomycetota bacterium]